MKKIALDLDRFVNNDPEYEALFNKIKHDQLLCDMVGEVVSLFDSIREINTSKITTEGQTIKISESRLHMAYKAVLITVGLYLEQEYDI